MTALNLYQFELCPYCHKVKAALDLKGIPYNKIEVNPMTKDEIKQFGPTPEGRKKVPVVEYNGMVIRDSSEIIRWLDTLEFDGINLVPKEDPKLELANTIDTWVNDDLTQILPTVLYGTWAESVKAAKLTVATSNFSKFDNIKVSLFGSVIMKLIAKRILKKRGNGKTGEELLSFELDKLENWLGEQAFLCGDDITLADAATHGALTCVKEFPAFKYIEERPVINAWYNRVAEQRAN